MSDEGLLTRPTLTLPDAEGELVRAAYAEAEVILEYGSGGSTVMAADMPGKCVFSVESDQKWAQMMRDWFAANPPVKGSKVHIVWSDIGATKEWGHPVNAEKHRRFCRYPLEVWSLPEFRQPDVVLIDGRFRPGCAMAAAFLTKKPVRLLVDDYVPRKLYHKIEEYLGPPCLTGRMAEFEVRPMSVDPTKLITIIEMMTRP